MYTATHAVEVPFPQAFAAPLAKSNPFPSAPRYGAIWLTREDHRSSDGYSAPFRIIRPSLLLVLWLIRSCFYLKERFTLEPANMIQLSKDWNKCTTVEHAPISTCSFGGENPACGQQFFHPPVETRGLSKLESL